MLIAQTCNLLGMYVPCFLFSCVADLLKMNAIQFTTSSQENVTGRLLHIRDDGLSRLPDTGPMYFIGDVQDDPADGVARVIHGQFLSPLYLTNARPGSYFVIGENGLPVFQRMTNVTFTVSIPSSIVKDGVATPSPLMQVGHGLFGSQSLIEEPELQEIAFEYGMVQASVDWWGLARQGEQDMMQFRIGASTKLHCCASRN